MEVNVWDRVLTVRDSETEQLLLGEVLAYLHRPSDLRRSQLVGSILEVDRANGTEYDGGATGPASKQAIEQAINLLQKYDRVEWAKVFMATTSTIFDEHRVEMNRLSSFGSGLKLALILNRREVHVYSGEFVEMIRVLVDNVEGEHFIVFPDKLSVEGAQVFSP